MKHIITRFKFTQKPRVIVSECTPAHETALLYTWKKCEVSKERAVSGMDLCSMICASLNVRVHGVITMLSLMKPRKKFDTITGTFVFHRVSHHLLQSLSSAVVPHVNALQYADTILTSLHSYYKA